MLCENCDGSKSLGLGLTIRQNVEPRQIHKPLVRSDKRQIIDFRCRYQEPVSGIAVTEQREPQLMGDFPMQRRFNNCQVFHGLLEPFPEVLSEGPTISSKISMVPTPPPRPNGALGSTRRIELCDDLTEARRTDGWPVLRTRSRTARHEALNFPHP
jgi:hypothetical protein